MAKKPVVAPKTNEVVFPEKGSFTDKKALQKAIKKIETPELLEWATLEGLTWKPCPEHPPIDRMRIAMAVCELHFPSEKKQGAKSESPYKSLTTEQLIEMAAEKSVPVEVTEDMRIMRMRTIMALRAAGHIG